MNKHDLKYPITVNGSTISSVTIRRPKGGDMVVIGDQVAEIMKFYAANAKAAQEIAVAEAAAKLAGTEADFEAIASKMTPPTSKVFSAMVDIAACLAGLGDNAPDLDVADLQDIVGKALNTGEALGRGVEKTGDE